MAALTSEHFKRMEVMINDVKRVNAQIAAEGSINDALFLRIIGAMRKDLVLFLEQTGWMNSETLYMIKRIERAVAHNDQENALSLIVEVLGMVAGVVPPAPAML